MALPETPLTRGDPNTQQTVLGTAANPWGDVSYSTLAAALYNGNAHAVMQVQMGDTVGMFSLLSHDGNTTYTGNASIGATIAASSAAEFSWKVDGTINYICAIAEGQIQEYTAYAAGMQTGVTIYWHPMS